MRLSRILFLALMGCAMVMSAVAQNKTQAPPPSQPPAAPPGQTAPPGQAPVVPPNQVQGWVPEGISALDRMPRRGRSLRRPPMPCWRPN